MSTQALSGNDNAVLSQIFDPESTPSAGILIDSALPQDPHVTDAVQWANLKQREKSIILQVEAALKNKEPQEPQSRLYEATKDMEKLINMHPDCACLLNDYAQILRLVYGNDLVSGALPDITGQVYRTLNKAILLLTPPMPHSAVSPAQCRTLAQAHTQRGALLHGLAKAMASSKAKLSIPALSDLTAVDLQEAASRDFFMGGRYGNEVGKALAVHTNPTAKLCGQMVQNAMRKEFAAAK